MQTGIGIPQTTTRSDGREELPEGPYENNYVFGQLLWSRMLPLQPGWNPLPQAWLSGTRASSTKNLSMALAKLICPVLARAWGYG